MSLNNVFKFLFVAAFAVSLHLFLAQGVSSGIEIPHFDKFAHFVVFLGLSMLFDLGFSQPKNRALLLALVYGISIEWLQSGVPGRQASVADIVFDVMGSASYYYFAKTWVRLQIQRLTQTSL